MTTVLVQDGDSWSIGFLVEDGGTFFCPSSDIDVRYCTPGQGGRRISPDFAHGINLAGYALNPPDYA